MLLNEIFGFGKSTPTKTIKKIAKILSTLSGVRHLAHTRQRWEHNKGYFDSTVSKFKDLQSRFNNGEDVATDLEKLHTELKSASSDWF